MDGYLLAHGKFLLRTGQEVSSPLPQAPLATQSPRDYRPAATMFALSDGGYSLIAAANVTAGMTPAYTSSFAEDSTQGTDSNANYKASTYIPLDSWIYPVFERLAGLGYMPRSTMMITPWTRLEGARLVAEAHDQNFEMDDDVGAFLLAALDKEFAEETRIIADAEKQERSGAERLHASHWHRGNTASGWVSLLANAGQRLLGAHMEGGE